MLDPFVNKAKAVSNIKAVLRSLEEKNKRATLGAIPSLAEQRYFVENAIAIDQIKTIITHMTSKLEGNLPPYYEPVDSDAYQAPDPATIKEHFHGMTGAYLSKLMRVNPRTIRKWIAGERQINPAAWRLFLIKTGRVSEPFIVNPDEKI